MSNEIEIRGGAIVVRDPDDEEALRVAGLFEQLFRRYPAITVSGVFGRWDLRASNPRKVLFVGPDYLDADMEGLAAVVGEAGRPVRLKASEGRRVEVRFK